MGPPRARPKLCPGRQRVGGGISRASALPSAWRDVKANRPCGPVLSGAPCDRSALGRWTGDGWDRLVASRAPRRILGPHPAVSALDAQKGSGQAVAASWHRWRVGCGLWERPEAVLSRGWEMGPGMVATSRGCPEVSKLSANLGGSKHGAPEQPGCPGTAPETVRRDGKAVGAHTAVGGPTADLTPGRQVGSGRSRLADPLLAVKGVGGTSGLVPERMTRSSA